MTAVAEGLYVYRSGLCSSSVCAPLDWAREQVEEAANGQNPTGISSPWTIDEAEHFAGPTDANGKAPTNPCPCEQTPGRQHWLLSC